jgi:hypothetical protein
MGTAEPRPQLQTLAWKQAKRVPLGVIRPTRYRRAQQRIVWEMIPGVPFDWEAAREKAQPVDLIAMQVETASRSR